MSDSDEKKVDEVLREIFSKCKVLKIDEVRREHIIIYSPEKEAEVLARAKRSLLKGHAVTYPDGRKVWYDVDWVVREGSKYDPIWHSDGQRIRKKRVEVTQYPDGRVEKKDLGEFWGEYD